VLAALERSGLTVAAFAVQEGVDAQRLYRWRRRFPSGVSAPAPAFIEVTPSVTEAGTAERFEVVLTSGMLVRVPQEFDPRALRRLVTALEGPEPC
jgi:transposase-like protein